MRHHSAHVGPGTRQRFGSLGSWETPRQRQQRRVFNWLEDFHTEPHRRFCLGDADPPVYRSFI